MDTVVCLNVLEHVEDDHGGLRNMYTALKPGGRAIVLVPHGQEIFGTLDVALGHYRRYSHEELRGKMEQAGFRVDRILDFNRISRPAWYFTGRVLKRKHHEPLPVEYLRPVGMAVAAHRRPCCRGRRPPSSGSR